ncbi:MAG: 50S ribosomal protein L10 [Clostridiales bacterium]|nr:50S ribosomal protein L10 [Clostridiales bacterium]MCF8023564.1 50S ribosomal protein L10 [Clostridiales bacterium]
MPTRKEKETMVEMIKDKFENSKVIVLTDYRGLDVAAMNKLRRKMDEADSEFKVIKNTLIKRVTREMGLQDLDSYLEGPTALATSSTDPVAPAKVLQDIAKEHKQLEIKAGVLEGSVLDESGIKALADLPSREVLLGRVVGGMQAPLTGFAVSLQGLLRNFVYALDGIREKKEAEEKAS